MVKTQELRWEGNVTDFIKINNIYYFKSASTQYVHCVKQNNRSQRKVAIVIITQYTVSLS